MQKGHVFRVFNYYANKLTEDNQDVQILSGVAIHLFIQKYGDSFKNQPSKNRISVNNFEKSEGIVKKLYLPLCNIWSDDMKTSDGKFHNPHPNSVKLTLHILKSDCFLQVVLIELQRFYNTFRDVNLISSNPRWDSWNFHFTIFTFFSTILTEIHI